VSFNKNNNNKSGYQGGPTDPEDFTMRYGNENTTFDNKGMIAA